MDASISSGTAHGDDGGVHAGEGADEDPGVGPPQAGAKQRFEGGEVNLADFGPFDASGLPPQPFAEDGLDVRDLAVQAPGEALAVVNDDGGQNAATGAAPDLVRGRVVVLWDGLPAHRSRRVAEFAQSQAHWLRLVRLPAYAPELNPVEYLWAHLKNGTTANYAPDHLSDLEARVQGATRRLRRRDRSGLGYLKHAGLLDSTESTLTCKDQ